MLVPRLDSGAAEAGSCECTFAQEGVGLVRRSRIVIILPAWSLIGLMVGGRKIKQEPSAAAFDLVCPCSSLVDQSLASMISATRGDEDAMCFGKFWGCFK